MEQRGWLFRNEPGDSFWSQAYESVILEKNSYANCPANFCPKYSAGDDPSAIDSVWGKTGAHDYRLEAYATFRLEAFAAVGGSGLLR